VRNLLVSYSETQLAQVQQTAACNAMHTIQQRLCHDRDTHITAIDATVTPTSSAITPLMDVGASIFNPQQ
jgi:hypothetical protein